MRVKKLDRRQAEKMYRVIATKFVEIDRLAMWDFDQLKDGIMAALMEGRRGDFNLGGRTSAYSWLTIVPPWHRKEKGYVVCSVRNGTSFNKSLNDAIEAAIG